MPTKAPRLADPAVPAVARRRLDGDARRACRGPRRARPRPAPRRARSRASRRPPPRCPRPASSSAAASASCDLGAGGEQRDVARAVGLAQQIGAAGATGSRRVCVGRAASAGSGATGEHRRASRRARARAPSPRRSRRVGRAEDDEVRDGAQRRQVLDRLVGRAVLAEADRVVRHARRSTRRPISAESRIAGAAVVGEGEEGAAVGDEARRAARCRSSPPPCRARARRSGCSGRRNRSGVTARHALGHG